MDNAWLKPFRPWMVLAGGLVLALVVVGRLVGAGTTEPVDSYASCAQAGYPIMLSEPPVCRANNRNFTGPISSPSPTAEPLIDQPFELLVSGDPGGSYPRRWQVIHTQSEWQTFWTAAHQALPSTPPLIPVDFAANDVVALTAGPEPTAGYRVTVTAIDTSPTGSIVHLNVVAPACSKPASASNPYFIVRTAKLPEPVSYVASNLKSTCQ